MLERAAGRAVVELVACDAAQSVERRETATQWAGWMRGARIEFDGSQIKFSVSIRFTPLIISSSRKCTRIEINLLSLQGFQKRHSQQKETAKRNARSAQKPHTTCCTPQRRDSQQSLNFAAAPVVNPPSASQDLPNPSISPPPPLLDLVFRAFSFLPTFERRRVFDLVPTNFQEFVVAFQKGIHSLLCGITRIIYHCYYSSVFIGTFDIYRGLCIGGFGRTIGTPMWVRGWERFQGLGVLQLLLP